MNNLDIDDPEIPPGFQVRGKIHPLWPRGISGSFNPNHANIQTNKKVLNQ